MATKPMDFVAGQLCIVASKIYENETALGSDEVARMYQELEGRTRAFIAMKGFENHKPLSLLQYALSQSMREGNTDQTSAAWDVLMDATYYYRHEASKKMNDFHDGVKDILDMDMRPQAAYRRLIGELDLKYIQAEPETSPSVVREDADRVLGRIVNAGVSLCNEWLDYLDEHPSDQPSTVHSFINSFKKQIDQFERLCGSHYAGKKLLHDMRDLFNSEEATQLHSRLYNFFRSTTQTATRSIETLSVGRCAKSRRCVGIRCVRHCMLFVDILLPIDWARVLCPLSPYRCPARTILFQGDTSCALKSHRRRI